MEKEDKQMEKRGYQPTGRHNFGYQPKKNTAPPPPPKTGSAVKDTKKEE